MHLGVLTGGGDVPGLNPAIKAVANEASARGWRVTGFRRGWAGPLNYNPADPEGSADWIMPLTPDAVRGIDRTGGTILHTSRTKPSKARPADLPKFLQEVLQAGEAGTVDCTPHILSVVEALGIDVLIAIGGDDTLSYAARLHGEGARTMCLPKTMDNDVFGTDYCIGFSTCVTRSVELINRLRTPVGSHERFLVVEMFGRNCGQSALMAGYLADVDRTLIAEVPFDLEKVARLLMEDRDRSASNYAIVVVSEGASVKGGTVLEAGEADAYGHRKLGGIGQVVGAAVKDLTGVNIMVQNLAYLLRAGAPDAVDLMVPKNFGTMAVRLIEEGRTGLMMAIKDGRYTTQPADISTQGERRVDVDAMYDTQAYRPRIASLDGMPMYLK
ncbi:MAG: 6-phosphofructokinase [Methyloligellaceae bacterium]